jgi:c-di-AMP phosphodiesterase-like protein
MAEQFFGGGGHFNAAGGRLDNISMEEAVERAKAAIEAFRNELTKDDSPNVEESSN